MAKANIHLERRYHRPTHVGQPMKEAHKPKQVFVERLQSEGNCSRETQPCCMLELISTIKAMQFLIPLPNKLNQGSPDIRAWGKAQLMVKSIILIAIKDLTCLIRSRHG
eukprot:scaffold233473_cov21-Tisochrysis_lutea.AAC.1